MFCRCQQSQSDYSDISPRNGDEDGGGEREKKKEGRGGQQRKAGPKD